MNNIKNILFLGYGEEQTGIINFLRSREYAVTHCNQGQKLNLNDIRSINPDLIISYGYKIILTKDITSFYKNRIINLHISYLPWNRGMHPNFWSFFDNTPKGITIHFIDSAVDTGDIIFQKEVVFTENENTLQKTYNILRQEMENLFIVNWDNFIRGKYKRIVQNKNEGSKHYAKDIEKHWFLMPMKWETEIEIVRNLKRKEANEED